MDPSLSKTIFFGYLDEESGMACAMVNRHTHALIFGKIRDDLKIVPIEHATAYSQVMDCYRRHCNYFRKKVPNVFALKQGVTLLEAKRVIYARLLMRERCHSTLLDSIWYKYVDLKEYERPCPTNANTFCLPNPNDEIQILARAGASFNQFPHSNVLTSFIKCEWCTLETVQMLVDKKIRIPSTTITAAIATERFVHMVPIFFSLLANDTCIIELIKNIPRSYYPLLERHIDKVQVCKYDIRIALENRLPERIILQMLGRCPKGANPYLIRLAIEGNYSEELILRLLEKSRKGADAYNIRCAIKN